MSKDKYIVIRSGRWRYDIARALETARQEGRVIVYTTFNRPQFLLFPIRKSLRGFPVRKSLLGQLRRLWDELVPEHNTSLTIKMSEEPAIPADQLRVNVSETLRTMPMEPQWYKRRYDIAGVIIPVTIDIDPPIEILTERFQELIRNWEAS